MEYHSLIQSTNNGWTTFVPHIYFEIYNHPGQERCLKYKNIAVRIFRLRQCNATCLEMDDVEAEKFFSGSCEVTDSKQSTL